MLTQDPRIDALIEKSKDFAKPILRHLRKLVHEACPEVVETIKWSTAFFDYKGPFCSMAAFNEHCAFGFWKGALLTDSDGYLEEHKNKAMGSLGRITSMEDLPADSKIIELILQAKDLNDKGIKVPSSPKKVATTELVIPDVLLKALNENKTAQTHFDKFAPGKKKEYVEWINEAKTEATRTKRLQTAIEWIAEGKARHWKYEKY